MTTGIYQMNFSDQAYYVGKSQDIEQRWKQHKDSFEKRSSAKPVLQAYDLFGLPNFTVVLECNKDFLDYMEAYFIDIQSQYPNCLNTTIPKLDPNVDYPWLLNNRHLLQHSMPQMLKILVEYHTKIAQLKKSSGLQESEQLVEQYHEQLLNTQNKLLKLKNKPLLERIFNW
jgi:hypothetical protein